MWLLIKAATHKEFDELYELASEAARLINGFIQYLRADRF